MAWNQEDFARELRRQLVELESLRRKLDGSESALQSVEKLEESILYLLRKLEELFRSSAGWSGDAGAADLSFSEYLHSMAQNVQLLEQWLSPPAADGSTAKAAMVLLGLQLASTGSGGAEPFLAVEEYTAPGETDAEPAAETGGWPGKPHGDTAPSSYWKSYLLN
ncbi:MAG: hypothetical protein JXA90_14020 [Planctomycetes bacterium]|nr:hypothetical protein [Planctomycetota bacterium]